MQPDPPKTEEYIEIDTSEENALNAPIDPETLAALDTTELVKAAHLSYQRSHPWKSRFTPVVVMLIVGVIAMLLLSGGAYLLLRPSTEPRLMTGTAPQVQSSAQAEDPSTQTFRINAKLKVQNAADINQLTVAGLTTLQGNTVIGGSLVAQGLQIAHSAEVGGNVTITGTIRASNFSGSVTGPVEGSFTGAAKGGFRGDSSGTFSGAATGSFLGIVSGTFNGGATGTFSGNSSGSFSGDGSALSNINVVNCAGCVQLQGDSAVEQVGNIALAGEVRTRKIYLRASVNDLDTFSVQTATGESLLAADTLNQNIVVGNLLPNKVGEVTAGAFTPGYTISNAATHVVIPHTGFNSVSVTRWSVKGPDGLMRFVYMNQDTSEVTYVRCTTEECASPVVKAVAADLTYWGDSPSIALDADGNAYMTYIDRVFPDTIRLVHCADIDCTVSTDQVIATTIQEAETVTVTSDANGFARVAYGEYKWADDYSYTTNNAQYLRCLNVSCSSNTVRALETVQDGFFGAMDIAVDGQNNAYISYFSPAGSVFRLKHCTDADCSGQTNADFEESNNYSSIALGSDGLPRLTYETKQLPMSVRYIRCKSVDCQDALVKTVAQATWGPESVMSGSLSLDQDKPLITYALYQYDAAKDQWYDEPRAVLCQDPDCTMASTVNAPAGDGAYASYAVSYTDSHGPALAVLEDSDGALKMITGLQSTAVPPVTVAGQLTSGISIGTVSQRFGQLYASGIDLQSSGPTTAMIINKINGIAGISDGSVASFQVNGIERMGIGADGNFRVASATGNATFRVDPTGNVTIGEAGSWIQTPARINLVGVDDNGAYLLRAADQQGIDRLTVAANGDITTGTNATCTACAPKSILNSVPNTGFPNIGIQRKGDVLYLTSNQGEVSIMDVSNVLAPRSAGSLALGTGMSASTPLYVRGQYGYLGVDPSSGQPKLQIYDLTSALHPKLVTTMQVAGYPSGFGSKGNMLYAMTNLGLNVYDISSPIAPIDLGVNLQLQGQNYNYGASSMQIYGTTAFIREGNYTVASIDLTDPANPQLAASLQPPGDFAYITDIAIQGHYMYYACQGDMESCKGELYVLDITDPQQPEFVRALYPGVNARPQGGALSIVGNALYLTDNSDIVAFDISNPSYPIYRSAYEAQASFNSQVYTVPMGEYLYAFQRDWPRPAYVEVLGFHESGFGGLAAQGLRVAGGASVAGSIQVNGMATLNADTTIGQGGNLIVAGVPAPVINYTVSLPNLGYLSGSPSVTYYYKFSALTATGLESVSTKVITLAGSAMNPLYAPSSAPLTAVAGSSGVLNGTFTYEYTYVTAYGETTGGGTTTVSAANQKVTLSNFANAFSDRAVTQIKIYRCSTTPCNSASYQLVGTLPYQIDLSNTSFVDNNLSPGAAMPTTNTARTDTNGLIISVDAVPAGIATIRMYRSTDGTSFTYQDYEASSTITDDGHAGVAGVPPATATAGRLGVGTSAPSATLHVVGNGLLQSDVDTTSAFRIQSASGATIFAADTLNQRIGIGLASPLATLHLSSAASTSLFRVTDATVTARDVLDIADTGVTTFRNQTNSTSAFRIQNASGTTFFSADTTNLRITIAGLIVSASLTVNGHAVTGNSTGTTVATAGSGAGASATCAVSGNDTSGTVTITTGASGVAAGTLCTVTFAVAYGAAPRVVMTANGNTGAALQYNVGSTSTTTFTLNTATAPAASTAYRYFYHVEQ